METVTNIEEELLSQAREMLTKIPLKITESEMATLKVNDFGLDNLPTEGFAFIDLLRTERVRVTLLILGPYQTLPQHKHPPYPGETGKEESVRTLWGTFKVYVEGDADRQDLRIPEGKEAYYTARKEIVLEEGEQYSVPADMIHWFQAGPEGSVAIAFQNRVNEDHNIFYDPASDGCPIPKSNT